MPTDWTHLPARDDQLDPDGYIYVIKFSLGIVKPGRTADPQGRFRQHAYEAAKFDGRITRWWLSPLHCAWPENERTLLDVARGIGRLLDATEHFADCDFDHLVSVAVGYDFTPTAPERRRELAAERVDPVGNRIRKRRRSVASRRRQGLSMRQIAAEVGVSLGCIKKDLDALERAGPRSVTDV